LGAFIAVSGNGHWAQGSAGEKKSSFSFSASYTGDIVSNFLGGIKKGTSYLGLANVDGRFDTGAAGLWKGGEAFANIGNTHGGEPSADLVGDFQGVSNIEAGNRSFLYELWYKQNLGKFDITVGLQDLNINFAANEDGNLFTNSSFGIHSSIADNITCPIFPLTALGIHVQWNVTNTFVWKVAVFDGTPDDFSCNPYNLNWKLSENQGFLAVSESQLSESLIKGKTGCYKLGVYYHQHNDTINVEQQNGGFYFVGDQQLTDKLSIFSQIGLSPKNKNKNNHYYSLGFSYKGLFNKRPDDQCGIAMAHAGIHDNTIGSETTVELAYRFSITKNIYIKPDIQYIINPAGTDMRLDNALVGFVRFGVKL